MKIPHPPPLLSRICVFILDKLTPPHNFTFCLVPSSLCTSAWLYFWLRLHPNPLQKILSALWVLIGSVYSFVLFFNERPLPLYLNLYFLPQVPPPRPPPTKNPSAFWVLIGSLYSFVLFFNELPLPLHLNLYYWPQVPPSLPRLNTYIKKSPIRISILPLIVCFTFS